MKTTLIAMSLLAIIGCASNRETQQIDMVVAQVISIDTIFRFQEMIKQVTWKDQDDIKYITYVPLYNRTYALGSSMYVMRRK